MANWRTASRPARLTGAVVELTDRDTVRAALGLLVSHGYLAEVEMPATASGGRPTLAYRIHPSIIPT